MYSEPCQTSKMELFSRLGKVIGSAFGMSLSSFFQSSKVFLWKCYTVPGTGFTEWSTLKLSEGLELKEFYCKL